MSNQACADLLHQLVLQSKDRHSLISNYICNYICMGAMHVWGPAYGSNLLELEADSSLQAIELHVHMLSPCP